MAASDAYTNRRTRLALRIARREGEPDGAWWPRTHLLSGEIPGLFASWPADNGQICQLLYSPLDWDDRPGAVPVPGRRAPLRTGNSLADLPRTVVLVMLDGARWTLAVVPPGTEELAARRRLREFHP